MRLSYLLPRIWHEIRSCRYKNHFSDAWTTLVAITIYGYPGVPSGGLVSACGKTLNILWILFTTSSTAPPEISAPCGRKFISIRRRFTSSIALTGVSTPLAALKLKEWNRIPYSRLSLKPPIRTIKSFLVKLSAFKVSKFCERDTSFLHNVMRATRLASQLVRSLKSRPLTNKIALADISEMFAFRGSMFATFVLVCFISNSPLTVSANAVTISKPIPTIRICQPRSAFNFCDLKSSTLRYSFLPAFFSIQSPQNTSTPPILANNEVNTVQDNQDADAELSDATIILLTSIPYLIFLATVIALMFRHHRKNRG